MNVVDALVVSIGIDASGLKQGAKEATSATTKLSADLKSTAEVGEKAQITALGSIAKAWNALVATQRKASEASVQAGKTMAGATERVVDSGEKAIRTFGALFLLFAGAGSLKNFASSMIALDASMGRLAHNTGTTTNVISGIGRAAERMGGSLDGAVGGIRSLSDAYQDLRLTGNNAIMEPLAKLQGLSGKTITFGKDVHANLLSIADALHVLDQRDPAEADNLARKILGDEGLANLAKKGRPGVLAAEAAVPKTSPADAAAMAELQSQLVGVRQGFQDIGNSILMDFGPAMISGAKWVKELVDANKGLIETKVKEWVKDISDWFRDHKSDIDDFGGAMKDLVAAAGTVVKAFMSQSPMMQAFEAFAVLMGGRVLSSIGLVSSAMTALGALPAPAWLAAITAAAGVTTYHTAQRTARDMSDGSLNDPSVGVDPETGLTFHVAGGKYDANKPDETPAPASEGSKTGGIWGWIKKMYGFGGPDESRVKDDLATTAKSTAELRDLVKSGASLTGSINGVTASSGGLGGSGRHADGSGPGASLRDRQFHGKGNFGEKNWWTPERQSHAVDVLMKEAGLSEDGAKALVSRWKNVESAGGPTAVNPNSGASGIAQGIGSRKEGYTGSFDDQLKNAARELNSAEGRAKNMLNTSGQEAAGASQFERAEGYDAATGRDNFTDRTQAGMGGIAHSKEASDRYAAAPAGTAAASLAPGQVRGTLKIGDESYAYGSGGASGSAHVPFGSYPINPDSNEPWGKAHNAMDVNGSGSMWDDALGRMRVGIEMHAASTAEMVTHGCLGFMKEQYPQLKARVREMIQKYGHAYLHVNEAGATITPTKDGSGPVKDVVEAHGGVQKAALAETARVTEADYKAALGRMAGFSNRRLNAAEKAQNHADDLLIDRYHTQGAPSSAQPVTVDHAIRHVLSALHHAQRLTHHNDNPVPVVLSDKSGKEMLYDRRAGAISSGIHHKLDKAFGPQHAAAYGAMMKMAESGRYATHATSNIDRSISSDTTINGGIHVHSAATDARGIAADIEPHLRRADRAGRADFGLG